MPTFHMPMSSPQMTTMFGFLSCAPAGSTKTEYDTRLSTMSMYFSFMVVFFHFPFLLIRTSSLILSAEKSFSNRLSCSRQASLWRPLHSRLYQVCLCQTCGRKPIRVSHHRDG